MKKVICIILTLLLILSCTGCASPEETPINTGHIGEQTDEIVNSDDANTDEPTEKDLTQQYTDWPVKVLETGDDYLIAAVYFKTDTTPKFTDAFYQTHTEFYNEFILDQYPHLTEGCNTRAYRYSEHNCTINGVESAQFSSSFTTGNHTEEDDTHGFNGYGYVFVTHHAEYESYVGSVFVAMGYSIFEEDEQAALRAKVDEYVQDIRFPKIHE